MTEERLNDLMKRFQPEQFLMGLLFASVTDFDTEWSCREYLVTRGIPMEKLHVQDKMFALMTGLLRRCHSEVNGRSVESLTFILGKVIDTLVGEFDYCDADGNLHVQAFHRTPYVELITLADTIPDPADYWKLG